MWYFVEYYDMICVSFGPQHVLQLDRLFTLGRNQ